MFPDIARCPLGGSKSPLLRTTGVSVEGTGCEASLPEVEPWLCSLYAELLTVFVPLKVEIIIVLTSQWYCDGYMN